MVQARAIDIEITEHNYRKPELMEGETKMLSYGLRRGIAPAVDARRPEEAVSVLGERNIQAPPINF